MGIETAADKAIMKFTELKVGQKVYDSWFANWGTGKVVTLMKTRVVIKYAAFDREYDKAHVQFLREEL
jgi:hypothetical protein